MKLFILRIKNATLPRGFSFQQVLAMRQEQAFAVARGPVLGYTVWRHWE